MAWEKVFSRRNWQNEPSTATPINDTNLNAGDSALDIIDGRVVALDSRVDTLEGYEPRVIGYAQSAETSKLNSEAYAVGTRDGVDVTSGDAAYHNNSKYYSEQAGTSATGAATSKSDSEAYAVGTRNGTPVTSGDATYHNNSKYYSDRSIASVTASAAFASAAESSAEDAEAYAVGKRDGVDVGSSDVAYHNNAKYYKEQAATSATNAATSESNASTSETNASSSATSAASSKSDAEAYAIGKRNGVDVTSGDAAYHNNSKYYSQLAATSESNASTSESNASASATSASNSASAADDSAEDSEAWAVGKRDGVDVPSTDETYHNNAKYWAGQAEAAAEGGVLTFNSRSGYVKPEDGDYSIDMITPTTGAAEGKLVGVDANGHLSASYDGGHKILNENGIQFTQRSKLKFINAEITDDSTNDTTIITVQGGGVGLSDVSGATITTTKRSVSITWTDPSDVIVDGTTLATWAGTVVVRKKGSAPQNKTDGTQIVNETVRNTYSSSPLTDTIDYDGTYYYRFFPYSTTGSVTKGSSVTSTPERVAITTVPSPSTVTYDGTSQSPTWSDYDSNELTIGGTTSGTNAGTYTATFTPTYDYKWSDDSASKSVNWTISKLELAVPTQSGSLVFDNTPQLPTWSGYDSDYMTKTETAQTAVGTYSTTFALIDTANTKFAGTDNTSVSVSWTINDAVVEIPTVTGTSKTYTGSEQSVTISSYDSNIIEVTGASATNAGNYTVTMHLKNANYKWSDTTTADKTVSWSIAKATLTVPTVTDTSKTYNGSSQSPTITGFDSTTMTKSGDSATDAGSYTVIFGLVDSDNYQWNSGTTSFAWSIARATSAITLSASSVTLDPDHLTRSVTVSNVQGRTLSVSSSDTSVATASINGSTVTISNVNQTNGNATITISAAQSTNYNASSKTISVSADFGPPDGSTVTPVNDIQTWLKCGGISGKSYTTISQVLSDTSTLSALIADSNAVDYMVRSTSWTSSVTANQTAMSYIGLNNYCSNTLLDDSTWRTAICNSTYFESVLNAKVPTMTSNTAPSGEASCDPLYASGWEAWRSFNPNLVQQQGTNGIAGLIQGTAGYIQYKFTNVTKVNSISLKETGNNRVVLTNALVRDMEFYISDDGSNWTKVGEASAENVSLGSSYTFTVSNPTSALYFRVKALNNNYGSGSVYTSFGKLQFYGRQDV